MTYPSIKVKGDKLSTSFGSIGCEDRSTCSGTALVLINKAASSLWPVAGWVTAIDSQATWANIDRYVKCDDE